MVTLLTYATRASLRPSATLIEIFTGSSHSRSNAGDALAVLVAARAERREVDEFWASLATEGARPQPRSA